MIVHLDIYYINLNLQQRSNRKDLKGALYSFVLVLGSPKTMEVETPMDQKTQLQKLQQLEQLQQLLRHLTTLNQLQQVKAAQESEKMQELSSLQTLEGYGKFICYLIFADLST